MYGDRGWENEVFGVGVRFSLERRSRLESFVVGSLVLGSLTLLLASLVLDCQAGSSYWTILTWLLMLGFLLLISLTLTSFAFTSTQVAYLIQKYLSPQLSIPAYPPPRPGISVPR